MIDQQWLDRLQEGSFNLSDYTGHTGISNNPSPSPVASAAAAAPQVIQQAQQVQQQAATPAYSSAPVSWETWQSSMAFDRLNGQERETQARNDRGAYDDFVNAWNNADAATRAAMDQQHGFGNRVAATSTNTASSGGHSGGHHSTASAGSVSGDSRIDPDDIERVEVGDPSEVFTMADVGDAVASTATAATGTATLAGEAAQAGPAQQVTAGSYEATLVDDIPDVTAATGQVSDNAIAQHTDGEITQLAGVAERDAAAETAALAETPEFIQSQESLAVAQVDEQPVEVQAAIAEVEPEELVTHQLDGLLASLENDEIPAWARPAVDSVNKALARQGMEVSTIGRDTLFNAIIQSAIPLAQSNAQAFQARATQNLNNRQQATIAEAEFNQQLRITNLTNRQQAALQNAALAGNIDLAKFNAEQQTALANSNFAQTMTMREFEAEQQSIIQNASALASMDLANLDAQTRLRAQNAQSFLQMDLANLSNEQQARVINQQGEQQRLLSNQAAQNAAAQFNLANQSEVDRFMANLAASIDQFNVNQTNAMRQFNAVEANRMEAINAENETRVSISNAQLRTQLSQFNVSLDQQREQWNVQNQQAISQADVAWRRQANTINTAAVNAANNQNVQNAFQLTFLESQAFWQSQRDAANNAFAAQQNELNRLTSLHVAALNNEAQTGTTSDSTRRLMESIETTLGLR